MLLVPAIDLRGGHCVRLLRGDFGAETRYDIEPSMLLDRYRELGARWLEPDLFRLGASSMLADIERQLEHHVTGRYAASSRHALA